MFREIEGERSQVRVYILRERYLGLGANTNRLIGRETRVRV